VRLEDLIQRYIKCDSVRVRELVQELWSGYGQILRVELTNAPYESIIVKQVDLKGVDSHPRGWDTDNSHKRKLRSYEVEWTWYKEYAHKATRSIIPAFLGSETTSEHKVLLMEDLDVSGYPLKKTNATLSEVKSCLTWLAKFHGKFMGTTPKGLWPIGTYWHLDTRPD